jgi:hypothetical protein
MKKIAFSFLFGCILCTSVFAQDSGLERYSLPVFIIQNCELASLVNDFIEDSKCLDNDHPLVIFYISFDFIGDDSIYVTLRADKPSKDSDSLILHQDPHGQLALIRHGDVLLRADIDYSRDPVFNYQVLTDMLKTLPDKQTVYLKMSHITRKGDVIDGNNLKIAYLLYDGIKWYLSDFMEIDTEEWIIE